MSSGICWSIAFHCLLGSRFHNLKVHITMHRQPPTLAFSFPSKQHLPPYNADDIHSSCDRLIRAQRMRENWKEIITRDLTATLAGIYLLSWQSFHCCRLSELSSLKWLLVVRGRRQQPLARLERRSWRGGSSCRRWAREPTESEFTPVPRVSLGGRKKGIATRG